MPPPFKDGASQATAAMGLAMRGIRNMVVWGIDHTLDLSVFNRLRLLGCNLVFFDHIRLPDAADFVGIDNRHAIRLMMDKACRNGCENFIFAGIDGLEVYSNREREIAFDEFVKRKRISARKFFYSYSCFRSGKEDEACALALQQCACPEKTALICVNDYVATLLWHQIRLPFQYYAICIETCDAVPGLTCVRVPMAQMATFCFDSLRRQMQLGTAWKAQDRLIKGVPLWERSQ